MSIYCTCRIINENVNNMKCYCVSVIDKIYDVLLENTKNRLYDVSSFLACLHFQDSATAELWITQ